MKNRIMHQLIWSFAGMAAAFGLIPLVDIAMAVVINHNLEIMLRAVWGKSRNKFRKTEAISGVMNGIISAGKVGLVIARIVMAVGQGISKAFDVTVIGLLIGQGISVGLNFGYTAVAGYVTWSLIDKE
eukprot:TRINITY_DN5994_c0_g1_i6.p1 TRINITY_DN5994_c0_g1~~TRINITY_DN5994_c0_g1_i6.p1  ORF type:complete len:128 (+),score=24.48 TRINITY_DN5994_c0_g1_i6:52-435(+)